MSIAWVIAALFLPLFPLSMGFVLLLNKIPSSTARALLLLVWPQASLLILHGADFSVPGWLQAWAVSTALLYAFRALVLRDVGLWIAFMAVSCWSLGWLMFSPHNSLSVSLYLLGFSLPLALMAVLHGELLGRFESAYAGLITGLAATLPKLAGLLGVTVLAITATPVFPGFFSLLDLLLLQIEQSVWRAMLVTVVWFLWAWSGMRLLMGLLTGEGSDRIRHDLSYFNAAVYLLVLLALAVFGLFLARGL